MRPAHSTNEERNEIRRSVTIGGAAGAALVIAGAIGTTGALGAIDGAAGAAADKIGAFAMAAYKAKQYHTNQNDN